MCPLITHTHTRAHIHTHKQISGANLRTGDVDPTASSHPGLVGARPRGEKGSLAASRCRYARLPVARSCGFPPTEAVEIPEGS